jgi:predicted PurR-regulated permease PerM
MDLDIVKLISEVGFPITAAVAAGYFVFLTLKFILAGVTSSVHGLSQITNSLDQRIDTMTDELQRVDAQISYALGLSPDYIRIARSEPKDIRKD